MQWVLLAFKLDYRNKDKVEMYQVFAEFMRREYGENPTTIKQALKDSDMAVILQVNDCQHWVVALRKALVGNDWLVADPWNGKKVWAKKVYRNVTGAAFFKRIV